MRPPRGGAEGVPLLIGGKSMGGRVASSGGGTAFGEGLIAGLICLGYPFHPPNKPAQLRTAHLKDLTCPTLIIQGERDPFGNRGEVGGLCVVDRHSAHLGRRRRSRLGPARGLRSHPRAQRRRPPMPLPPLPRGLGNGKRPSERPPVAPQLSRPVVLRAMSSRSISAPMPGAVGNAPNRHTDLIVGSPPRIRQRRSPSQQAVSASEVSPWTRRAMSGPRVSSSLDFPRRSFPPARRS